MNSQEVIKEIRKLSVMEGIMNLCVGMVTAFFRLRGMLQRLSLFISLVILFSTMNCLAATPPSPLPQTGQTSCFDSSGFAIACSGTGQDGEYKTGVVWPNPRFKDNGDQTVTDMLTGLVWAKDANLMKTRDPAFDTDINTANSWEVPNDGMVTWQHALDYIKKLNSENYLGYNDWRLPNRYELESLVNLEESSPDAWLNGQGFSNVQPGSYWSATTFASITGGTWIVGMYGSFVGFNFKTYYGYVLPVRAGQPGSFGSSVISKTGQTICYDTNGNTIACSGTGQDGDLQTGASWPTPRFTDSGNQTVTDTLTGLIWSKDGNPGSETRNWQQALDYIKKLNAESYLGHSDWRLPNQVELKSLVNMGETNAASWLIGNGFSNVQYSYWSSSSYSGKIYFADADGTIRSSIASAFFVDMGSGGNFAVEKSRINYVWPVRGGFSAFVIFPPTATLATTNYSTLSTPVTFTLINGGEATVAVSAITISALDATQFSVAPGGANPCSSLTPTLDSGASCSVNVTFAPTSTGARIATLHVASNATGATILDASLSVLGPVPLPQTGQTTCYNASGSTIACVGTGQDGDLKTGVAWANPRFSDNGDQTIADKLTGLIWSKDANPAAKTQTWQQGLDYVKTLNNQNYLGHSDWRLPNRNELESLVNRGQSSPGPWLNSQEFINVKSSYYWSSSTSVNFTYSGYAWVVDMSNGSVDYNGKTNSYYVWPVRSGPSGSLLSKTGQTSCYKESGPVMACSGTGQDGELQTGMIWPTPRFTDSGDQTMTDNLTGLAWSKNANPAAGTKTWQGTLDYIKSLNSQNYQGHNDWRLPNINELKSLINQAQSTHDTWINGQGFSSAQPAYYWSSSTAVSASSSSYAWAVSMSSGRVYNYSKTLSKNYVWPVRSGQSGSFGSLTLTSATSSFAITKSGVQSSPVTFTINNFDAASVTVSAITIIGAAAKQFSVTPGGANPCASLTPTLASGASCTVNVIFAPSSTGEKNATLLITTNGNGSAILEAALSGTVATPLFQTGQTTCYDATGATISCTGTRQDGDLKTGKGWPNPRFTDNGDQTVTDKLTGLIWSKDANSAAGTKSWQKALDYIKTLNSQNYLGYNDWRLPNIKELKSLVNPGESSPATWLNLQEFLNVRANFYWSSTTHADYKYSAWHVNMADGEMSQVNKTVDYYVWPVRSGQLDTLTLARTGQTTCYDESGAAVACSGTGQDGETQAGASWPNPRFSDNSDQTVTDNLTSLVWCKYAAGTKTWQQALDYIKTINIQNYLGYSDWRLPNQNELESLVNYEVPQLLFWLQNQGFDLSASTTQAGLYWSSSTNADKAGSVWIVNLWIANQNYGYKTSNFNVRAVRGGIFSLSPATTTFAATNSGNQSAPVTFTLANGGSANITVSAITITGTDADQFSLVPGGSSPCASLTPALAVGANCTMNVTFSPTSTGAKSATLQLTSNDTTSPTLQSALTGIGEYNYLATNNFDTVTTPALPSGWVSSGSGGSWSTNRGTKHPSGVAAHSPGNLVYFNSYDASSGKSATLISPFFSLTNTAGATLRFWMYRDSGNSTKADLVNVYINRAATLTGASLLGTVNRSTSLSPVVASAGWYQYTFDIPNSFTGATNYLLIEGMSGYGNDIHLDDIEFSSSSSPVVTLAANNFDSATTPLIPSDWFSSGSGAAWSTNNGTMHPSGIEAHSPGNLVYFNSYDVSNGQRASLISPAFSLTNTSGAKVSFWMYRDTGYSFATDLVNVYINRTSTLTGASLLGTINRSTFLSPAVSSEGWYQYSFDIPGTYTGATNHLLIEGVSGYGNDIHIDDIKVFAFSTIETETSPVNLYQKSLVKSTNGTAITGSGPAWNEPDPAWHIVATGDVNGDHTTDLIWQNRQTGAVYVMPIKNATEEPGAVIHTEPDTSWKIIAAVDINGNGATDLIWWHTVTGQVAKMSTDNLNAVTKQIIHQEPDTNWRLIAAGDIDGDTKADLIWKNRITGQVYVMPMNGNAVTGGGIIPTETGTSWEHEVTTLNRTVVGPIINTQPDLNWLIIGQGDFNGDGIIDLLWHNKTTGQVYLMLMKSTTEQKSGYMFSQEPNTQWKIVATGDVNGDGTTDILWWNNTTGQVYGQIIVNGKVSGGGIIDTNPDTTWEIVSTGDTHGSGKSELFWWNSTTGQLFIGTTKNLNRMSTQAIFTELDSNWRIAGVVDINGDSKSDIIWHNRATGQVYAMLINGTSITGGAIIHAEPDTNWDISSVGDYNNDGKAEILWQNIATGQVYLMELNGLSANKSAMLFTGPNTTWYTQGETELSNFKFSLK